MNKRTMIKTEDEIFHELTEAEFKARKPLAYFGWEGDGSFSFICIADGYFRSANILLSVMTSHPYDAALVDTLIYPLFFNYRHSIESYLKAIFFNHGERTDDARSQYLRSGHKLKELWLKIKGTLQIGKDHVGSSVDLDAVEYYINEIDQFDPYSMVMRYPIDKKLDSNKLKPLPLDFILLGERMKDLYSSLELLNSDLSNQIADVPSDERYNRFLDLFRKNESQIGRFLSLLKSENISQKESLCDCVLDALCAPPPEWHEFLEQCNSELLILLDLLYRGGKLVNVQSVHLAVSDTQRKKEFVKVCYDEMERDGLSFNEKSDNELLYIKSKKAEHLSSCIDIAISILCL